MEDILAAAEVPAELPQADLDEVDKAVSAMVDEHDLLVECQGELKVAEEQVEHLRAALVTARRIGAAVGVLMTTGQLTDDEAFARLCTASQNANRKVRELAEDVLRTGTLET